MSWCLNVGSLMGDCSLRLCEANSSLMQFILAFECLVMSTFRSPARMILHFLNLLQISFSWSTSSVNSSVVWLPLHGRYVLIITFSVPSSTT